jgi:hypothetical protein
MAATGASGASSFLEQAAMVRTALHVTTIKLFLEDLFAKAADMASPFFYAMARVGHPLCATFYA